MWFRWVIQGEFSIGYISSSYWILLLCRLSIKVAPPRTSGKPFVDIVKVGLSALCCFFL
jgi:hypothetical protein